MEQKSNFTNAFKNSYSVQVCGYCIIWQPWLVTCCWICYSTVSPIYGQNFPLLIRDLWVIYL